MESLQDKLKSLGVSIGASHIIPPTRSEKNKIEDVLDGEEFDTPFGTIFIAHSNYPPEYQHGKYFIGQNTNPEVLASYTHLVDKAPIPIEKIAFLDTETSGLSGGTGSIVFLIGIGYFTNNGFHLAQIFLRTPGEEAAFLSALEHIIAPFELVITYNGKSFDIPLLNTRHSLNLLSSPFTTVQHIDLLHLARQVWKTRLSNRALSNLEVEIIQFQRTQEEIPGWLVPGIYFDYLKNDDAQPLAGVFYHNAMDILSLVVLYHYLSDLIVMPADRIDNVLEMVSIASINESKGKVNLAISLYSQALERGLPKITSQWTLYRLANIYKRNRDWDSAIIYWSKAAENDHLESCIELAKYYEHHARDMAAAIHWAQRALVLQGESESRIYLGPPKNPGALDHRIGRLQNKIKRFKQE